MSFLKHYMYVVNEYIKSLKTRKIIKIWLSRFFLNNFEFLTKILAEKSAKKQKRLDFKRIELTTL